MDPIELTGSQFRVNDVFPLLPSNPVPGNQVWFFTANNPPYVCDVDPGKVSVVR